jgi:hypothetical protein
MDHARLLGTAAWHQTVHDAELGKWIANPRAVALSSRCFVLN